MVRQMSDAVVEDRLEIIEAKEMCHRCLLGSHGKPTVAKSGSLGNLKLPANPKLELLTRRARPLTPPPLLWLAGLPQGSRVALSPARRGAPRRRPQGRRLGPHASHIHHEHGAAHDEKSGAGAAD